MTARHDQLACGTTTAGTGTLTLAALPAAITAIDPFAAFSGNGWGTSQGVPVDYSIVEYTDGSFTKPKQSESGRGFLLLGANLATTTLTRTLPLQTVTGMNAPPATVGGQSSAASAISIGTAANVVIWFGLSSFSAMCSMPFYSTSGITNADNAGVSVFQNVLSNGINYGLSHQRLYYQRVLVGHSDLIKSVVLCGAVGYTGGTASLKAALYAIGSSGLPGKMLIDFGTIVSIPSGTVTLTAATPVLIPAGYYILGFLAQYTGGSGSPAYRCANSVAPSPFGTYQQRGMNGPCPIVFVDSQAALADPAVVTGATAIDNSAEFSLAFRRT